MQIARRVLERPQRRLPPARLRLAPSAARPAHAFRTRSMRGGPTASRASSRPRSPTSPPAQGFIVLLRRWARAHSSRSRARLLCAQSQPALPPDHRHDRAALPRRAHLVHRLPRRVARLPRRSSASHHAPRLANRHRSSRRGLHALRRLDSHSHRMDHNGHRPAAPRASCATPPSGSPASSSSPRPSCGSSTTASSSATGSTSPAALTPPRLLNSAPRIPARGPPHPGWHNPWVSLIFFMRCAQLDATIVLWANRHARAQPARRHRWLARRAPPRLHLALLLWIPAPFYAYSVAYGSVPIFNPVLVAPLLVQHRYGMELLPAFALGLGFCAQAVLFALGQFKTKWVRPAAVLLVSPRHLEQLGSDPLKGRSLTLKASEH